MELFKTLSRTVSDTVDYTVHKTGEMIDIARLKLRRARIAEELHEAYTEIGHLVYHQYSDNTDRTAKIASLCLRIDEGNAEMQRLAESIEGIRILSKMADEKPTVEKDGDDPDSEEIFDTDDIAFSCVQRKDAVRQKYYDDHQL